MVRAVVVPSVNGCLLFFAGVLRRPVNLQGNRWAAVPCGMYNICIAVRCCAGRLMGAAGAATATAVLMRSEA